MNLMTFVRRQSTQHHGNSHIVIHASIVRAVAAVVELSDDVVIQWPSRSLLFAKYKLNQAS